MGMRNIYIAGVHVVVGNKVQVLAIVVAAGAPQFKYLN